MIFFGSSFSNIAIFLRFVLGFASAWPSLSGFRFALFGSRVVNLGCFIGEMGEAEILTTLAALFGYESFWPLIRLVARVFCVHA